MAIKRIFTLIEDDGTGLSAQLATFADGARTSLEEVDLSKFPGNIVELFFGPATIAAAIPVVTEEQTQAPPPKPVVKEKKRR